MTTYIANTVKHGNKAFKTTSIRKAREYVEQFNEPAMVCQFVRWNEPMPIVAWNGEFADYVAGRGKDLKVGMTTF